MSEAQGADKKDAGTVRLFGHEVEKKKAVGAGIALVCVLALIVFCFVSCSSGGTQEEPAAEETVQPEKEDDEDVAETYVLDIAVEAEGWDAETSSPVIVHIEGENTDFYHAYDANDPDAVIVVEDEGEYELTFISPINADGSIYKVPETVTVEARAEGRGESSEVSANTTNNNGDDDSYIFTKVEAEDATADDIKNIVDAVTDAVKKGDDTLTSNAGVKVVEKVEENAKANPNSDDAAVEDSAAAAEESASSGQTEATGATPSPDSETDDNKSASSTSSSTSSQGSGQNSNNSTTTSTSSHTHNYNIPITKTVHHEAEYTTVHHDAVTHEETTYKLVYHDAVIVARSICNGCGEDITGNVDAHMEAALLADNIACGAYHTEYITTQEGYEEQVASGTTTVVDQDAYDEQVLVSEAWDETVITGYKCSCGAVQ